MTLKNVVSFVDGHVSYIKIFLELARPILGGTLSSLCYMTLLRL